MNEIIKIQQSLLLCEYWNFLEKLEKQLHYHKCLQLKIVKQYETFKVNIQCISYYKNIPVDVQNKICACFFL